MREQRYHRAIDGLVPYAQRPDRVSDGAKGGSAMQRGTA